MTTKSLILLIFSIITTLHAELFTSVEHLENSVHVENSIIKILNLYTKSFNSGKQREKFKSIIEKMENHNSNAMKNPYYYIANPIGAFLFVKRFTLDWDRVVDNILKSVRMSQDLQNEVDILRQNLPNYEDLKGVVESMFRVQDTYQLNTTHIAEGYINGHYIHPLSAEDCFHLGRLAYRNKDYYHTHLWMKTALEREQNEANKTISRLKILKYFINATRKQGNIRHALSLTNEILKINPRHKQGLKYKSYFEEKINKIQKQTGFESGEAVPIKNERILPEYKQSDTFRNYESLCRGEELKMQDTAVLRCRYHNNDHPLLIIQPAKEEELHLHPKVVVYHDFISDTEIDVIKSLSITNLVRSLILNDETEKSEPVSYRISKHAWINQYENSAVDRMSRRIEAITGLTMDTAESLQVANYGVGGQYEQHYDFARENEEEFFKTLEGGNRIATWLNYMSDVPEGGATVFPLLGVKISPQKGAAAFWYNLYRNGKGIDDVIHAACPVAIGSKWVSSKWLNVRGQEYRRPCSVNPRL